MVFGNKNSVWEKEEEIDLTPKFVAMAIANGYTIQ